MKDKNNCVIITKDESNMSTAMKFSNYIGRKHFKTVRQGQPSNIIVSDIFSDRATIKFDKRGTPSYYEVILEDTSRTKRMYTIPENHILIRNLTPGMTYIVNVIAHYISGQFFEVNKKVTFMTDSKWGISNLSIIYPENTTFYVSENINQTPVHITFDSAPGNPVRYQINIPETDTSRNLPTKYLDLSTHTFYIRNDISTRIEVIAIYDDPTSSENEFSYEDIIPPYYESISCFNHTSFSNYVDVHYTRAPGRPTYIFKLYDRHKKIRIRTETLQFTDFTYTVSFEDFTETVRFDKLTVNTHYVLEVETKYDTTKNRYINRIQDTYSLNTLNRTNIRNLELTYVNLNELSFKWDPPYVSDGITYQNIIKLSDVSTNDIIHEDSPTTNIQSIDYHDLSMNHTYAFSIETQYTPSSLPEIYIVSNEYTTLYEGSVQNLEILNITGTSIDVSFQPFHLSTTPRPSIPNYYIIYYTKYGTDNIEYIESYFTQQTIYNKLESDTSYSIAVSAVYPTGHVYDQIVSQPEIRTLNEAPPNIIEVYESYGNRVDLSWSYYDNIDDALSVKINTYLNGVIEQTLDLSYDINYYEVPVEHHNANYRFSIENIYSSNKSYEKSIYHTNVNEYSFIRDSVIVTGSSIEITKSVRNNQDSYYFIRKSEGDDPNTYEWVSRPFITSINDGNKRATVNTDPTEPLSLNPNTYYYANMTKNGNHLLYCPDKTNIHVYTHTSIDFVEATSIGIPTDGKPLYENFTNEISNIDLRDNHPDISNAIQIYSMGLSEDGSTIIIGYNTSFFDIFTSFIYDKTIQIPTNPSKRRSQYVSISKSGNVCSVGDDYVYNDNQNLNGVYVFDVTTESSTFIQYPNTPSYIYDWYNQYFEIQSSFDSIGHYMGVRWSLFTRSPDRPIVVDSTVVIYEKQGQNLSYVNVVDISGTYVSLNSAGTNVLIVNDYDVSNNIQVGNVKLFELSANLLINEVVFWGSENTTYELPYYRNASITEDGKLLAIGEYTYSYSKKFQRQGQIIVHENNNGEWYQKGVTLRQDDVKPLSRDDRIRPGEWFGYFLQLDNSGNLMTGTRPKLSHSNGQLEGDVFIYHWQTPIFQYPVSSWPVLITNLQPNTVYEFEIKSIYNYRPEYSYDLVFSQKTLANEKPEPFFTVYNDQIDISWNPIPNTLDNVSYIMNISLDGVVQSNENLSYYTEDDVSRNSYQLYGLSPNTDVSILFMSVYIISQNDQQFTVNYVGFDSNIRTLNESEVNIQNLISLNTSNLVVLDIQQPNIENIDNNDVEIRDTATNNLIRTVDLSNTTLIDLDENYVVSGQSYRCDISSSYFPTVNTSEYNIQYVTKIYTSSSTFIVSTNAAYPDQPIIQNGRFNGEYEDMFTNTDRPRTKYSRNRGIYLTLQNDIDNWGKSEYVYVADNKSGTRNTNKLLDIQDISFHAILFRSEDLTPGIETPYSYLEQSILPILFVRNYTLSFYIANQDMPPTIYNNIPLIPFSGSITYQVTVFTNEHGTIYETSLLHNGSKDWQLFQMKFFLNFSIQNVKLRIKRMNSERNNLYISDVSMISIPGQFDDTPVLSMIDSSWNTQYADAYRIWNDTYDTTTTTIPILRFSTNSSISFWFYSHIPSISYYKIFQLGDDEKVRIDISGNNLYLLTQFEDDSTEYNVIHDGPLNTNVPHFVCVSIYDKLVDTYFDGEKVYTYQFSDSIIEADVTDQLYISTPTHSEIAIKHIDIYDHALPLTSVQNRFRTLIDENNLDSTGNTNDLFSSKVYDFENQSKDPVQVQFEVFGDPNVKTKSLFPNEIKDVSPIQWPNTFITDTTTFTISYWAANNTQLVDRIAYLKLKDQSNTTIFDIKNDGSAYPALNLNENINHISLVFDGIIPQYKLYLNGYYYHRYDTAAIVTLNSGLSLYNRFTHDGKVYAKAFTEEDARTAYYDAIRVASIYDISGRYEITIAASIASEDISYEIVNVPDYLVSDISDQINGTISFPSPPRIDIVPSPYNLNTFNRVSDSMVMSLQNFNSETTINGSGNPYIQHAHYNENAYLTEGVTVSFELININPGYTFAYEISGDIQSSDLDTTNGYAPFQGDISNIPIVIKFNNDTHIDNRIGYERFEFHISNLNLATTFDVYEPVYFDMVGQPTNQYFESSFAVRLISKTERDYDYIITGVDTEDIDVSLTGIFSNSVLNTDTKMYEFDYLKITVTADPQLDPRKFNLPFKIALLSSEFAHVSDEVLLNEAYNILSNKSFVNEGESFEVRFQAISTAIPGTEYSYIITGISNDDIDFPLNGTLIIDNNRSWVQQIQALNDDKNEKDNETFNIKVIINDPSNPSVQDVSTNVIIKNVDPIIDISFTQYDIDTNTEITNTIEGKPVTVKIRTQYIPSGTYLKYTIEGNGITTADLSGTTLTGTVHIQNDEGELDINIQNDFATDPGDILIFTLLKDEYSYTYSKTFIIQDTSQYPVYDISVNPVVVEENGEFTVTISTNLSTADIDYALSGTGIFLYDILYIDSLSQSMILNQYENGMYFGTQTFKLRPDFVTEGDETLRVGLIGSQVVKFGTTDIDLPLSDIFTEITILDTTKGPTYEVITTDGTDLEINTVTNNESFTLRLITENLSRGSRVGFSIDTNGNEILLNDRLLFSDNKYYGAFINDYINEYSIDVSFQSTSSDIIGSIFQLNGNLQFKDITDQNVTSTIITLKRT
jgi:hypothetical protein